MSKTAFLFPGQGAQSVGMGQQLIDQLPAANAVYQQADDILGYSLSEICLIGPKQLLDATEHSQPALLVNSIAALKWIEENNPQSIEDCQSAAGLSLGEYTALVFAEAISFEDGLRLVRERGLAMQAAADAQPSGMVSVLGLHRDQVEQLCDRARQDGEVLQIANLLCPGNIAISGHQSSCQQAVQMAEEMGAIRAIPLTVAGAFHTSIMQPAEQRLQAALDQVDISPPRIPIVSNVDAEPHSDPDEIRNLLVRQVCSPVMWEQSMRNLIGDSVQIFYEVGNGRVLRGLMKRVDRKAKCHGVLD